MFLILFSLFIFGLLIGSFLNVVIYRLPIMLKTTWTQECRILLEQEPEELDTFNLMLPRSHCPHCQQLIAAYYNIPIISYLMLKGRCAMCRHPISIRYPLIELTTGLLTVFLAWYFGITPQFWASLILTYSLICIFMIDIDEQIIPDIITLPLLWLGLLLNTHQLFTSLDSAVIGAIAGYSSLWLFTQLWFVIFNKIGMGHGDFKLFALFGAWVGWQALPFIIICSSFVGAALGITQMIVTRNFTSTKIPFGPYLAIAGWIGLLWGLQINEIYLSYVR